MDHLSTPHSCGHAWWSSAHDRHARGGQCHLLRAAGRLPMRAFAFGGSRRSLLSGGAKPWIPLSKRRLPVAVQDPCPNLQQQMGTALRPLHLLLLAEALADDL